MVPDPFTWIRARIDPDQGTKLHTMNIKLHSWPNLGPWLVPGTCGPGSWFLVPGSWFLVPGSWFLVPGSWFLVRIPGPWFLVPGSWFLVRIPGPWFLVPGKERKKGIYTSIFKAGKFRWKILSNHK